MQYYLKMIAVMHISRSVGFHSRLTEPCGGIGVVHLPSAAEHRFDNTWLASRQRQK
jgi:hypothetical protein